MTVRETIQARIDAIRSKAQAECAVLEAELAKGESWLQVEWEHAKNFAENVWTRITK